jgi:hypothetical protein
MVNVDTWLERLSSHERDILQELSKCSYQIGLFADKEKNI